MAELVVEIYVQVSVGGVGLGLCQKLFSAMFPSFSMFMNFFLCLVLAGRLNPSHSPLLLVTLLLEDMTVYNKMKDYTEMHEILF